MILQMFHRLFRGKFDPLQSLLVVRDGEFRGQEKTGIYQALLQLKDKGFLALDATTALAELHKTSQKSIRLWERVGDNDVRNPLECHAVIISPNLAALVTTGEATLHQGTAEPMTLVCDGEGESLRRAVEATAIGAQLNWGSPGVAQRLPVVFKRTDEEFTARVSLLEHEMRIAQRQEGELVLGALIRNLEPEDVDVEQHAAHQVATD